MQQDVFETPILFLIFNRPDTTRQVFDAIRQRKPRYLYVASDGPRQDRVGEKEKVEVVRKIATDVDWDCEVVTLFREKNLGCKVAVSSAIDWFFEHVEEGIILEDDCVPNQSFFQFCSKLLKKYKYVNNVWEISGVNLFAGQVVFDASYAFSRYGGIWGWATWKRAWAAYDVNMDSWMEKRKNTKWLKSVCTTMSERIIIRQQFDAVAVQKEINTWDYQWVYTKLLFNGLSIIPQVNMIQNIGFGEGATHTTKKNTQYCFTQSELSDELVHPESVYENQEYQALYSQRFFVQRTFLRKVLDKIKGVISENLSRS